MKTAIYINTFAKMANYDLESLSKYGINQIAIVSEDEYEKFNNAYKKYFSNIFSCPIQSKDDFEKISFDFARNIVQQQINLNADVRIICLSEDNLLVAAKLRDEFNIPGLKFDVAVPFRNKIIMKNVLKSKNIRVPHYSKLDNEKAKDPSNYFEDLSEKLGLPFIAKPTSFLGGLGVVVIDSVIAFTEFCKNSPIEAEYEVEEFIAGTLFHCDSIRKDGKTIFSVSSEYNNPNFDFQLGKPVISMPLKNDDPLAKRIFSFNETVLDALNYERGVSHHELFLTKNDELIFLEIAARSPGVVTPMYRRAFNIGMEDIGFLIEMDIPFELNLTQKNYFTGIFPIIPGRIDKLIDPPLKSKFEIKWVVKEGDVINASKSVRDKSASITAWNDNYVELKQDFDLLRDFKSVLVFYNVA
jgi:biotin carboxylase